MAKKPRQDEQAPQTSPLADDAHAPAPDMAPPSSSESLAEPAGTPAPAITHPADADPNSVRGRMFKAVEELAECEDKLEQLGDVRKPVTEAAAKYTALMEAKPAKIRAIEAECGAAFEAMRQAERSIAADVAERDRLASRAAQLRADMVKLEAQAADEAKVAHRIRVGV